MSTPFDPDNVTPEEAAMLKAMTPDDVALGTTQLRMACENLDQIAAVLGSSPAEVHFSKIEMITASYGAALLAIAHGCERPDEIARLVLPVVDILTS